jgi:hypothetical protein
VLRSSQQRATSETFLLLLLILLRCDHLSIIKVWCRMSDATKYSVAEAQAYVNQCAGVHVGRPASFSSEEQQSRQPSTIPVGSKRKHAEGF